MIWLLKQLVVLNLSRLSFMPFFLPPIFSFVTFVAQVVNAFHKVAESLLLLRQLLLNPLESFRQLVVLLVFLFRFFLVSGIEQSELLLE